MQVQAPERQREAEGQWGSPPEQPPVQAPPRTPGAPCDELLHCRHVVQGEGPRLVAADGGALPMDAAGRQPAYLHQRAKEEIVGGESEGTRLGRTLLEM